MPHMHVFPQIHAWMHASSSHAHYGRANPGGVNTHNTTSLGNHEVQPQMEHTKPHIFSDEVRFPALGEGGMAAPAGVRGYGSTSRHRESAGGCIHTWRDHSPPKQRRDTTSRQSCGVSFVVPPSWGDSLLFAHAEK